MARSIYQGSAAAVCQARELSARRRARGLEKKATGSFPLSLCLSLLYPPVLPLSFPFSLFHVLVRGLSLSSSLLFSPSLSLFIYLSFSFSLCRPFSAPSLRHSTSLAFSLSFAASGVIFHRCSGRQKRRDGGGGVAAKRTRRRAREQPPHGGDGTPIHAIPRSTVRTILSDISS